MHHPLRFTQSHTKYLLSVTCAASVLSLGLGLHVDSAIAQSQTPPQAPPQAQPPAGQPGTPPVRPADSSGKPRTDPNSKDSQDKGSPKSGQDVVAPIGPRVANPLILNSDPLNPTLPDFSGLHPGAKTTVTDRTDYTRQPKPGFLRSKRLQPFGYDYFASARSMIDAMRAYYLPGSLTQQADKSTAATAGTNPNSGDVGTFDPTTNTSIVPSAQTPLSGIPAGSISPGAAAAAGILGAGSILSQGGTSPLGGPTTAYDPSRLTQSGQAGSVPNAQGGSYVPGFTPQVAFPQPFGSIDTRAQVFGPIQGQFHNVIANPPAGYQLGPGDVITIQYSAPTVEAVTLRRTIDATGKINMQSLGAISLVGKTIDGAEQTLTIQMRRMFKAVQVTVSLDQIRTISVSVVGHSYEPGTYSMPAVIATAYNLLWWSGGPTFDGSLRDVEVRRQGKTVGVLDLYRYELGATSAEDVQLQSGDVLYIPGKLSNVTVDGEVRTPAIYELKPGESLQEAIRFTGGVKASAVSQRVQINTVQPGASRVLRDIDLSKPDGGKTALYDGDVVEVLSVRNFLTNSVVIEGAVDQPSEYALTPNMRVSDLVNRARGLLDEAYPQIELHRYNSDGTDTLIRIDVEKALAHDAANDVPLVKWDRVKVYTREDVAWTGHHFITIDGQVRKQGVFTASKGMRVSDALRMAGGPLPDAYLDRAVLMHHHEDGPPTMEFVSISGIVAGDTTKDPLVQDNDHLAVYAVGQAHFTPDHVVTISGEVVAPGPYPRSENMKLSALLSLAGGRKPGAGDQIVVTHARQVIGSKNQSMQSVRVTTRGALSSTDDVTLEDGDVVTIQGLGGYVETVQTVIVSGAVEHPGPIPLTSKSMRLSDAIKLAGGLRKEAYTPGAEFHRDPKGMLTNTQVNLAQSIGKLRDLLNNNEYQRDAAVSRLDIITATGQAQADSAGAGLLGLAGGASAAAAAAALPSAAASAVSSQLANGQVPVTAARTMTGAQIQPDGALAVNLPLALQKPGGNDDILLKDGDQITVPEAPTTVQLIGAVVHPVGVVWKPGKQLQFYISQAGGFTFDAAKDSIEIIRAGGGIITAKKVKQILPGDVIYVPTKPVAASIAKHSNAFNDFFKSLTSSVLIYGIAKSVFGL